MDNRSHSQEVIGDMNRIYARVSAAFLAAGLMLSNAVAACAEEPASEAASESAAEDVTGTLGFAECDEETYVNVRSEASTDSGEVIGILKNHDSAVIESVEDDGWYKIKSGDVEGYAAAWLIKTGDEAKAIAEEVAYNYAVNHAVSLNVRSAADESSEVVASLDEGAEAEIVADEDNWFKVALDADTYGYVSKDYVEEKTAYPTGDTIEEMLSEAEAESQEDTSSQEEEPAEETVPSEQSTEQVQETETAAGQENALDPQPQPETVQAETPQTETPQTEAAQAETEAAVTEAPQTETAAETEAPGEKASQTEAAAEADSTAPASTAGSATGAAVVAYASQFVGNPYVWGGTSLTSGADCSGFTQSVFANFGVYLPHDAASQLYCGTQVSIDDLAPGDLVFFSSGSGIDHVAIYAGNGSIIHAANKDAGICWGSLNWMTPVGACRVV